MSCEWQADGSNAREIGFPISYVVYIVTVLVVVVLFSGRIHGFVQMCKCTTGYPLRR